MVNWPGGVPVAGMLIHNPKEGPITGGASFIDTVPLQKVLEPTIQWEVKIRFYDDPNPAHGHCCGYFEAKISRYKDSGNWDVVDIKDKILGDGSSSGDWQDTLTLETNMIKTPEQYKIELRCETKGLAGGQNFKIETVTKGFTAQSDSTFIGDFTVNYVPVSIVYCPPDQGSMSASLTQSQKYGTRMTISKDTKFAATYGASAKYEGGGSMYSVDASTSVGGGNSHKRGIEVSYFRETVLTVDNEVAVEDKGTDIHGGPLFDLFVITTQLKFGVYKKTDNTYVYSPTGMGLTILVPAHQLLRPNDPVVKNIDPQIRRNLLELDPFITNLDKFFPKDSGAPLSDAVNPKADPSVHNRAELLGIWWLSNSTELSYGIGKEETLETGETTEFTLKANVECSAGLAAELPFVFKADASFKVGFSAELNLQSSKETTDSKSQSASCHLIRNHVEKDPDAIAIYYDKIFSTLMFRRIPATAISKPSISGTVYDTVGKVLDRLDITLAANDGKKTTIDKTMTNKTGQFNFYNLKAGETYIVIAGDKSQPVQIEPGIMEKKITLKDVKRDIDLQHSPTWAIAQSLLISSDSVRKISQNLNRISDHNDVAQVCNLQPEHIKAVTRRVNISWPQKVSKPSIT